MEADVLHTMIRATDAQKKVRYGGNVRSQITIQNSLVPYLLMHIIVSNHQLHVQSFMQCLPHPTLTASLKAPSIWKCVYCCCLILEPRYLFWIVPHTNITAFSSQSVVIAGVRLTLLATSAVASSPFCITQHGVNIVGLDLFHRLGFSAQANSGSHILQMYSPRQDQY